MTDHAYGGFAAVYDSFMDNVPYEKWADYLCGLLEDYGVTAGALVLELGCGTGTMTELLARRGYDMIGVDRSEEMLQAAIEKREASGLDILYLLQDMREFELYGTVAAVVSICDSMNYLTEYADLVRVFQLANNYLDPKGVFIFDMNTVHVFRDLIGGTTIAESRENAGFIWENFYDEERRINEYDLTLFVEEDGDLYRRYDETHCQRAYDPDEIRQAAEEAGMEFVAAYDVFTRQAPREDSERFYVVLREHGKGGTRKEPSAGWGGSSS